MESKEILAVVVATLGIILVIGILSLITKSTDTTEQDSKPVVSEVSEPQPVYLQTDIWDVLRAQNTTTVTTETTNADGEIIIDETGTLPEGETVPTDISQDVNTAAADESAGSETETMTVTEESIPQQTYMFVFN